MDAVRRCLFLVLALSPAALAWATLHEIEARAIELKAKGDAAGALEAYREAAALDPKSPRFEDEIGFLLAVLNRRAEAIAHFQRAIDLDARFAPAQYHLGAAWFLDGNMAQSIPHLQTAAALDPGNPTYRSKFGEALEA